MSADKDQVWHQYIIYTIFDVKQENWMGKAYFVKVITLSNIKCFMTIWCVWFELQCLYFAKMIDRTEKLIIL